MTDFPSLQKSLPRKRPEKSPANSNCFSFSFRIGVTGVLTVVSYMYMSRISSLVSCSIFSTKVCLLALNLLYFRGVQQNKIYKSSSCSSSSLLLVFKKLLHLLKLVLNDKQIILHSKQIV